MKINNDKLSAYDACKFLGGVVSHGEHKGKIISAIISLGQHRGSFWFLVKDPCGRYYTEYKKHWFMFGNIEGPLTEIYASCIQEIYPVGCLLRDRLLQKE